MGDPMNLDSSDLVGSLDEFEHLESIPADFDTFSGAHEEVVDGKMILPHSDDAIDIIQGVHSPNSVTVIVKEEEIKIDDSQMETDVVMDHDEMSMGAIGSEIDMDSNVGMENLITVERELQEDDSVQDVFSGEIIEEVIVGDDQIIEEVRDDDIVDDNSKTDDTMDSMDHYVKEEVVGETTLDDVSSFVAKELEQPVVQMSVSKPVMEEIVRIGSVPDTSKMVTPGVYVVATSNNSNIVSAQSFIPSNTVFTTQKDQKNSGARLVMSSVEGSGATLRILPGQSKVLSTSHGRAITLSQARQMGLLTQAKLSSLVPTILPKPNTATSQIVTSVQQVGNKVTLPKKGGTVAVVKSPTKILPVPSCNKQPQKLLIRQATAIKPGTVLTSPGSGQVIRIPANQALGNIHQIQLPGKPVQYVKLVSGTGNKTVTGIDTSPAKAIPVALAGSIINSPSMFKLVPIASNASPQTPGQRVLIPATQPATTVTSTPTSSSGLVVLPTHIIQASSVQTPVPVTPPIPVSPPPSEQVTAEQSPPPTTPPPTKKIKESKPITAPSKSQPNGRKSTTTKAKESTDVPIEPATITARADSWSGDEASSVATYEANGIRPRKPCNCTKSRCLKLYCDCFANGEFCNQCNCTHCYNNLAHEEERQRAIKSCLERNPTAFRPKIGKSCVSDERRHNKGCNCRRSGCLKNYCECYEAKIPCSMNCKCLGCRNVDSPFVLRRDDDPRVMTTPGTGSGSNTLLRLIKAGDSVSQRLQPYHSSIKQAYSQMSNEVVEATCQCLLAQAEDWERDNKSPSHGDDSDSSVDSSLDVAQSLILEEFSRCITQIIECVAKSTSSLQDAAKS